MAIKKYKPTSSARRFVQTSGFEEITKDRPENSLTKAKKRSGGRNSQGRITVRHRGGGHKRKLRIIDFKREKFGIPARVDSVEYDPNRSARIALLVYADGEKRYIVAPAGLKVGSTVVSGEGSAPAIGNTLPLSTIPLGSSIHNVELQPGRGGQLVRSAGLSAVLMSREGSYANVRMPSGEIRLINCKCMATMGQIGNQEHENEVMGKAGHKRWLGIRPTVRGVAMNPVDHPMGGGEGKATGGHPQSPWGLYAKGKKTRKKSKSNKFIIKRRK